MMITAHEREYGIIAYYATGFGEGDALKTLYIELENEDAKTIWDIAKKNETRFPHGQLIKVELIPT